MIGRRRALGWMAAAAGAGWTGLAWAQPRRRAGGAGRPARPDLTGVWTNGWYTQLERPDDFKAVVATPEEAEAYEAVRRPLNGMPPSKEGDVGQPESEFNEAGPGLARIRGEIRAAWVVDPPDGKIPWTAEARERYRIGKPPEEKFDHVEQRHTDERCLTARGAGAPILNSPDTNYIQIVQTPDHVAIVSEKNHDARIVATSDPQAHPGIAPAWMGVSTGRWEGPTLVVESTGWKFTRLRGIILTETSKVTERFSLWGPDELGYEFTVEDPTLYQRPWRGEMVFRRADRPMYEFACHEGNYSLTSILSGARQAEAAAADAEGTKAAR